MRTEYESSQQLVLMKDPDEGVLACPVCCHNFEQLAGNWLSCQRCDANTFVCQMRLLREGCWTKDVRVILKDMHYFLHNSEAQIAACKALQFLAYRSTDNRSQISKTPASRHILEAMHVHMADNKVIIAAGLALINLSAQYESKAYIVAQGIHLVLQGMDTCSSAQGQITSKN